MSYKVLQKSSKAFLVRQEDNQRTQHVFTPRCHSSLATAFFTFRPVSLNRLHFCYCYEHSFPQCSFISCYLISGMSFSTSFLWLTLSHFAGSSSGIQVCERHFLWELYIASVSTMTPNAYFSQSLFFLNFTLAYWSIIIV